MKLTLFGIEKDIILEQNNINVLEIEDKKLFTSFINLLNEKCNGNFTDNNELLLKQEDTILNFEKEMLLVLDVFNIDYNSKKILGKIYKKIEDHLKLNESLDLENLILPLREYLISEINEFPFEFTMKSDLAIEDLLKCFSLKIDSENYTTLIEKLDFVISSFSCLKIANVLVFVNLKSFLCEEDLVEFYKYVLYNNVTLLLLENSISSKLLKYENKLMIDKEFDEFKL